MDEFTVGYIRRRTKRPAKHVHCYICHAHPAITECHHLYPVKDVANDLSIQDQSLLLTVWLCPNCHRYYHAVEDGKITLHELIEFVGLGNAIRLHSLMEETKQDIQKYKAQSAEVHHD